MAGAVHGARILRVHRGARSNRIDHRRKVRSASGRCLRRAGGIRRHLGGLRAVQEMVRNIRGEESRGPQRRRPGVTVGRKSMPQSAGAWLLVLAGCFPQAHADPSNTDAPGIAWFRGDVGAAFDLAKAANKPVFLYWGAKWCPPCQQLKSSVFLRSDFIAKSKEFVAVYLD